MSRQRREFDRVCVVDGRHFTATRYDAEFCSSTCRSRHRRAKKAEQKDRDVAVDQVKVIIARTINWKQKPDVDREVVDMATLAKIESLCRNALLELSVQRPLGKE